MHLGGTGNFSGDNAINFIIKILRDEFNQQVLDIVRKLRRLEHDSASSGDSSNLGNEGPHRNCISVVLTAFLDHNVRLIVV